MKDLIAQLDEDLTLAQTLAVVEQLYKRRLQLGLPVQLHKCPCGTITVAWRSHCRKCREAR